MTKLESLVPSLELCRRLEKAGYPQGDSYFYWDAKEKAVMDRSKMFPIGDVFAAPTVSELGMALPEWVESKSIIGTDGVKRFFVGVPPAYRERYKNPGSHNDTSEANARASMLCHLLESKLLGETR